MKKSLLKRTAAWAAAVAMLLSPAGTDLAGITALAAESISINDNSGNIGGDDNSDMDNNSSNDNDDSGDNDNNSSNDNDDSGDNDNNSGNDNDDSGDNDNNSGNDNDDSGDNDNNSGNDDNNDSGTDEDDNENTDDNNNDDENNNENEEEDSDNNDLPYVEHYVSPISGEGLLPYEYYDLGEIEFEEGEEPESFAEAPSYNDNLSTYSSKDGYNALSETLREVYSNAYSALVTIDSSADYDAKASSGSSGKYYFDSMLISDTTLGSEELFKVFVALMDDNPQFFWLGHGYSYGTSGSKTYISFGVDDYCSDCCDGDTRMEIKEQLMTEIEKVIDEASVYGNEYSKEWYIHNYLCEKTVYDLDADHAHDISGILVGGRAVCESYAKCFQLFMNALDINVLYVAGTGNGGGHAWNQIGLDNGGVTEWYNVDVTWDDSSTSYNYNYFNVVDSSGGRYDFTEGYNGYNEHTPLIASDREYLYPVNKCASTTYSYANHETNYVESGEAVAQVGSKTFYSLNAAIKSIRSSGQTIELLADVSYKGAAMPSYSLTIDGDGKYAVSFDTNMTLNADLTLKDIAGIDKSDFDYSSTIKTITIGAHTLTVSGFSDDNSCIPVMICGSTTKNKGSVIITSSDVSVFLIENVENLTLDEGSSLTLDAGAFGTNLTLGKNAVIINSSYVLNETYYSDPVDFTTFKQSAGSVLKIDNFVGYNYFLFDNVSTSAGITLTVDEYLDEEALEYAPLVIKNKISVDDIILDGESGLGALSRNKNQDGYYYYFLSSSYNYTISDGTNTSQRVTLDEILELISEKNNTKADYIISAVSENKEDSVEGAALNALKAKSVAFDKISVKIATDVTLKCGLSFNSGAEFEGKVNAGAYKLTLGEGDYIFHNALTSASAVSVSGGKMTLEGAVNNKAVSHSVKELSLANDGYVFVNGGSLKITSALLIAGSKFSAVNGAKAEITSISSTGEAFINSYNEGAVTVTGNVTLTDSKPIILSSIDFTSEDQKNIVSSGQTAIIVKSKNVTADMFTTSAKTAGDIEVALEKSGNEIRFATSAFTCGGNNYSQWSGVLQYINSNPGSSKTFEVTLLDDVTIDELTLPEAKNAGGVKLIGGKTITIKNKTLKVTVDLDLDEETSIVMNSNKSCAVTVAAGKSINGGKLLNAGRVTGTAASAINAQLDAVSISTFRNIEGNITVSGTVTGVTFNKATVNMLAGSNVTASTGDSAVEFRLNANGNVLPKLTFSSVGNDTSISIVDGEAYAVVASGTVIAYSSKQPANEIRMSNNKTSSEKELDAVYYSSAKAIKAEYTGALTLSSANGEIGNFSSLELAFDKIKGLNDKNASYSIRLNDDVSASSFKLPTAAADIQFEAITQKSITLSNVTAVSLPVEVTFQKIKLESNKPFTMAASKNLNLTFFTSDSLKQLKGGTKSYLSLLGGEYSFPIAGFGKIILDYASTLSPKSSVSYTELDIRNHGGLVINDGVNVTIKNISGDDLDYFSILYSSALYTPFTVTGKVTADVNVGIKDGKFNEGQLAFKAASADLSCFEISKESKPEGEFTFSRDKSNVYVKGVNFTLKLNSKESKMAEWSDVVSSISAANNKDADYTVTLLDDYVMYSTMTMPKKGTFSSLTINSVKSDDAEADEFQYKYFDFVGSSITLTGDTKFENIGVYGFKKSGKSYNVAYYKINAGKNALVFNNADAPIGGITSSGKLELNGSAVLGNVTAGSAKFHSVIFAGNTTVKDTLNISGVNAFLGTLSVGGINAVDTDTYDASILMVYGKKFSVGKSGVGKDDLTIGFVTANDYSDKTLMVGDKVCDITGDYYGNIKIDGQDELNVIRSGNKLVCVDTKKTSVYKLTSDSAADLTYISLKDMMTDINRMNDPEAEYTVKICQNESIKGSLPVPSAKKYSKITFIGENDAKITVTGDIKLTGDLDISGIDIKKVNNKGIEQVMNYTIGNYTLTLGNVEEIGKVTGAKGSVNINADDSVEVTGSINVASFTVEGDVIIGPKASFTASNVSCGKFTYSHSIASKIKIGTAEQMTLCILDASGKALEIGEAYAGKALMGQYKGNVSNINLENKLPDGYVLATGKSNMLTIGKVVCKAGNDEFASVRDAVNSTDSAITLLEDITMTEILTIPEGIAVTFGETEKTLKLKGITQVNGSLTFNKINVTDASSVLGMSFKLSGKGNLKFSGYKSNVNINAITTGKLEAGYGNIELNEVGNVNFNGSVKCSSIIADSSSKINLVKDKSLQLDECINGAITLVDKNGKPVTIKQNDSVYKVTKPVDDVKTTLTNKDANEKSHKLVYSKGYIKVGEVKE